MGLLDLVGLFGSAVGAQLVNIGKIISTVVNGLLALIRSLETVLTSVVNSLVGTFQKLVQFIIAAWDWLVKSWLVKLIAEIRKIRDKINTWLAPIIKQIQIIRQQQQIVFDTYIKPLLNFISRLRQALLILRAFHVKFAAQLDQDLATIQGKIAQVVIDTRAQLNQLTDWINIILDPLGNLSYGLYIQRALSSIGALFSALHAAQDLPLGAKDQAQQSVDAHSLDSKNVKATTLAMANGGLQPEQQTMTSAVYTELQNMGYQIVAIK